MFVCLRTFRFFKITCPNIKISNCHHSKQQQLNNPFLNVSTSKGSHFQISKIIEFPSFLKQNPTVWTEPSFRANLLLGDPPSRGLMYCSCAGGHFGCGCRPWWLRGVRWVRRYHEESWRDDVDAEDIRVRLNAAFRNTVQSPTHAYIPSGYGASYSGWCDFQPPLHRIVMLPMMGTLLPPGNSPNI